LYGTARARAAAGGAGGGYELFTGNIASGKTTLCRGCMEKISDGRRAARQDSAVNVFKGIGASGAQIELIESLHGQLFRLPLAQRTPHPTSAFILREISKLRKAKSVSLVCPTLTNALRAIFLTLLLASSNAAVAESLPVPLHVAVAGTPQQIAASVLAARRYAAFWNTGNAAYATAALAPGFMDRTLPAGRPQGPSGPLLASKMFRSAVPDLKAEIQHLVVAGDRVSVHLRLKGHFTGRFGDTTGTGQAIDLQAFDLYRVENGQIMENWHLEDNLGLMQQMGILK